MLVVGFCAYCGHYFSLPAFLNAQGCRMYFSYCPHCHQPLEGSTAKILCVQPYIDIAVSIIVQLKVIINNRHPSEPELN